MIQWLKEQNTGQGGGQKLLGEEQGAVKGFSMGITLALATEYGPPATHDDQEGFYVISGEGYAMIGGVEYKLEPGICLLAKANEPHTMKRTSKEPLKYVWSHGAI